MVEVVAADIIAPADLDHFAEPLRSEEQGAFHALFLMQSEKHPNDSVSVVGMKSGEEDFRPIFELDCVIRSKALEPLGEIEEIRLILSLKNDGTPT